MLHLLTTVFLSGLLGAAVAFHRAPDLSHIRTVPGAGFEPSDLAQTITQVVIKQSGKQSIEEGDLNAFLASVIAAHQRGTSARFADPESVLVDLGEDTATLHFCWRLPYHRLDAAVETKLGRVGGELVFEIVGGSYGRLRVPKMLLAPLRPALRALAAACEPELQALQSLPRLSISKEKLVLDPTF